MGCCTGRCLLVTICTLQLVSTVQRQVIDFLGYMWAPIIANFLQIIFIIIGLFGTCQYRPKVVIVYSAWCMLWIGWNVFVICLYLEVGILSRESPILNLGTGYKSWWLENGIGCTVSKNYTNYLGSSVVFINRKVPPENAVSGCLLQYQYVEVIQAGAQCLFALFGFITACYVVHAFTEEDDSCKYFRYIDYRPAPVRIQRPVSTHSRHSRHTSWVLPTYVSFTDDLEDSSALNSVAQSSV